MKTKNIEPESVYGKKMRGKLRTPVTIKKIISWHLITTVTFVSILSFPGCDKKQSIDRDIPPIINEKPIPAPITEPTSRYLCYHFNPNNASEISPIINKLEQQLRRIMLGNITVEQVKYMILLINNNPVNIGTARDAAINIIISISKYDEDLYNFYFGDGNIENYIIYKVSLDEASAGEKNRLAVRKLLDLYYEPLEVILSGEKNKTKVAQLLNNNTNIIKDFILNEKTLNTNGYSIKYNEITNMERLFATSILYNSQEYLKNIDDHLGTNYHNPAIQAIVLGRMEQLKNNIMNNKLTFCDNNFNVAVSPINIAYDKVEFKKPKTLVKIPSKYPNRPI